MLSVGSVGSVAELRRYPVKSLAGEVVASTTVDGRGLGGDRLWAVRDRDGKLGSGKSTHRFRKMEGLLDLTATYTEDREPVIEFPDGRRLPARDPGVHQALSDHVGRPVRLLREGSVPHFDVGPLHLVTTASMATLARAHGSPVSTARTRANMVVEVQADDGMVEDGWIGRTLAVGPSVVIRILEPMRRCVMVGLPQVGLPSDARLLKSIADLNDTTLGVAADVVSPGVVTVGDPVALLS